METLPKIERLCGKASISDLLKTGRFGHEGCLKYCWKLRDEGTGPQCNRLLVSVSKRFFKRAVKRNLLKRRLREAYRRQKHIPGADRRCDIMLIYNSGEILDYKTIYLSVEAVLKDIASHTSNDKANFGNT